MKWKEFFKPSLSKIIIILLLIVLTYFFGIIQTKFEIGGKPVGPNPFLLPFAFGLECSRVVSPLQYPWYCTNGIQVDGDLNNPPGIRFFLKNYPLQIISNVIYWYLLSCLLVWIFNKFKRK